MSTDQEVISGIIYAPVDLTDTGDLVSAIAGQRIVVHSIWFTVSANTTVRFRSGGSTGLSGPSTVVAGGGIVLNQNKAGWLASLIGEKLDLLLSTPAVVGGTIGYTLQ